MASSLSINDINRMIMEYIPPQEWGTVATLNREWRDLANEDGMKLWKQIEQVPNIVFIAKNSAAIKNATTAKEKMKALGAILHRANRGQNEVWEHRGARRILRNLGDHSGILLGFGRLADTVTNKRLLRSAIISGDFTLFESINLKMFLPEEIDEALKLALQHGRTECLGKLIPEASSSVLPDAAASAVKRKMQDAAKQILKSKKAFSVDQALINAARYHTACIPLIRESGRPFSVEYHPVCSSFMLSRGGLQAALFGAIDTNNMSSIEALLQAFKTLPSREMLKHARDRASYIHIFHQVNDNPPFAGQPATAVFSSFLRRFNDGTDDQRQAIHASLPRRYRIGSADRPENQVFVLSGEDHDLRPMIARLDLEIAARFPEELDEKEPQPQPAPAQHQTNPIVDLFSRLFNGPRS